MLQLARGVRAFFAFMTVFLVSWAASAQEQDQVQTIGSLSFAVPEGWQYEHQPGAEFANLTWKNANGAFCIIFLTDPVQTSGDADKDFVTAWRATVEPDPEAALPAPIYDIQGMMGYPGKYGGAALDNRTKEVWLYLLEVGGGFVPVVVIAPNREVIDALHETLRAVIGSVRVAPLVAVPLKTTITVADLVGFWTAGDASVVSYVNTTTGTYAGSSTTFYGEYYTILSDGQYTYDFQGMSGGQVTREKAAGTVEFGEEFVIFHEQPSDRLTRYRFISYEQGLGGGTLLTLLPESYSVTPSNIAMYASRFVREPVQQQ